MVEPDHSQAEGVLQLQQSFTQLSIEENWATIILESPRFFVK